MTGTKSETPKRYHPLLVALHWIVALLIALDLYLGLFVLAPGWHTDLVVAVHMTAGLSVLTLTIVRFAVRQTSVRPALARAGNGLQDGLAAGVHSALYLMLITITLLGLALAWQTGHFQEIYLGQGEATPAAGEHVHAGEAHESGHEAPEPGLASDLTVLHLGSAYILLALVTMHVAAAAYHQFLLRDGLLTRMWFGSPT